MFKKTVQSGYHVVLWGAWYGSRNVGDQALLLTITSLLEKELGEVKFTVLTDDPVHVLNYTTNESCCNVNALQSRRQFHRVIQALFNCDLFIFGGGVPFFELNYQLAVMSLLVGLVRIFRKPYMTWAVASQVVNSRLAKQVFRWVLNGAAAVTYRDQHTGELFRSCGVSRPMKLVADSGYWLEPASDHEALEIMQANGIIVGERPLFALTPRTLRGRDGEAEKHYNVKTPGQFEREIMSFSAALDWSWENGYQPIFIPMNTIAPDDDRIAAHRVMAAAKHGKKAVLIDQEIRPRLAPAIYKQCDLSFVARLHGSITSFIAGCPVMMYAFAPKHAGIMDVMCLSPFIMTEGDASPERCIQLLSTLKADRVQIRRGMVQRLKELRSDALIPARIAAEIVQK